MKAIQCKELSEPDNWNTTIEFNDIEDPKFNNDQVLIEIIKVGLALISQMS